VYAIVIRPNIAFAVHLVRQFMVAPCINHYVVVLHIFHYVKGSLFQGLHFPFDSFLELKAHSDFDWAGDPID